MKEGGTIEPLNPCFLDYACRENETGLDSLTQHEHSKEYMKAMLAIVKRMNSLNPPIDWRADMMSDIADIIRAAQSEAYIQGFSHGLSHG